MAWLYTLPSWLVGFLFVAALLAVALPGHRLFRRLVKIEYDSECGSLSMAMLAVVAMILSLLLAFSPVSVWEAYGKAEDAVEAEASVAGELVRDMGVYGGPLALASREAVKDYLETVIRDEWPAMAKGGRSKVAAEKMDMIFHKAALIEPRTAREEIMLAEIWDKANELNVHRRARVDAAGSSAVPAALWAILLLGVLLNFLLFYLLPVSRLNDWLLGLYAAMLGLMLFFIFAMDYPFAGNVSISPAPLEYSLQGMALWDSKPPLPELKK